MYPYSGLKLIELLEKQHKTRASQNGLFKAETFNLLWRTKVGSFPHPDLETLVSAGEPCGSWRTVRITKRARNPEGNWYDYEVDSRPEDKREVGDNWQALKLLPLNGYIPGSAIRGIVRAWAKKRPNILPRMVELLGTQEEDDTQPGKIEFLDAFPEAPTKLSLDIVNPQEDFQVYHQGQGTPLSFYTLGNGDAEIIPVKVAIRGIPGRASVEDVEEVWRWIKKALNLYGVGSRTASGYGVLRPATTSKISLDPGYSSKQFEFKLYSQGNSGPDMRTMELRASHWRGWLRSWVLRFLLGVMSELDAETTLGELLGTLTSPHDNVNRRGSVRIQMIPGNIWGEPSNNQPTFFNWQGSLQISAPTEILNKILLPIIRFATMVGSVGRGWRRPLHIYTMPNGKKASRGSLVYLTHQVKQKDSQQVILKPFGLATNSVDWQTLYQKWRTAVQNQWSTRFIEDFQNIQAEVFSPATCAVYLVPDPLQEPVDKQTQEWSIQDPLKTRGKGIDLIYCPRYKRKIDVGGDAAGGGNAHCSWVSIKRIKVSKQGCQEVICLFMGGEDSNSNHLRSQFLKDLASIPGAVHLFGVQPPNQQ